MNGEERDDAGEQQNNDSVPPVVSEQNNSVNAENKSGDQQQHTSGKLRNAGKSAIAYFARFDTWDRDDVEVLFSFVVALASIVGIAGLIVSSVLTLSSLSETRKATEASLISARAAETANRITENSLRARLVVGENFTFTSPERQWLELAVSNDGNDTARRARWRWGAFIGKALPDGPMPLTNAETQVSVSGKVAPSEVLRIGVPNPGITLDQMVRGEVHLFFFGRIEYETLGVVRFTEFCYGTLSSIRRCHKWNDAN